MIHTDRRLLPSLLSVGVLSLALLGLSGCLPLGSNGSPARGEVLLFYVENRTDRPVHLQVIADQEHLFAVDLEAATITATSGEGRELPPTDGYRGKEIKVIVKRLPEVLEVREVLRELRARFSLAGLPPRGGFGYRIVVSGNGIEFFADYVPIR